VGQGPLLCGRKFKNIIPQTIVLTQSKKKPFLLRIWPFWLTSCMTQIQIWKINVNRETPKNIEAEQHVLAGLAGKQITADAISVDDFYDPKHKLIYMAVLNLKEHLPVNSTQVWKELEKKGQNTEAGGELYVIEVLDRIIISDQNADYWLKELKEASNKRKLKTFYQQGIEDITNKNISTEDSLAKLNQLISETSYQTKSTSLTIISAKDLLSEEYEKVESLWGDILFPSSIVQLNSEPGLGKTTLMYNLLLHGGHNKPFLNINFSKKIKTFYVDVETPRWAKRRKLELICDTEPRDYYFVKSLNLNSQEDTLIQAIIDMSIDVLVLDTQSRVFQQEDENNNAQANSILSKLRYICKETGVCIVLVHHLGKDTGGNGVYSGRGASAVAAGVDIVINLSSLDSEVLKLEVVKNRLNSDYFVMGIKKIGDDRFEPYEINDEKSLTLKSKVQDEIIKLPEGRYKAFEIQSELQSKGYAEPTIRRALSGLAQSGKVKKIKHGEYEIYGNQLDIEDENIVEAVSDYDLDNNTIPF